jgi:hypothetical protein
MSDDHFAVAPISQSAMLSSKSDSRKTQQLGSDDLVPFDHAAAGQ